MTNQCLISSYKGDFVWLQHCLRSLRKHAVDFLPPVISVSFADLEVARAIVQATYPDAEVFLHSLPHPYTENVAGFGMMRAMSSMMHGDILCPKADNIFLVGSDCLAVRTFQPRDYLGTRGEPIVLMNSYEHLRTVHPDAVPWRNGTALVMGYTPRCEYMRRLPSVFHRTTFYETRKYIEHLHGMPFTTYWFGGYALGQRGQSEANLLGAYAHRFQPDIYRFEDIDRAVQPHPTALLQMWSHGGLDKPIDIHYLLNGRDVHGRLPRTVITEVLGDAADIVPK